jgi:aconitate hydratase
MNPMPHAPDPFGTRSRLDTRAGPVAVWRLEEIEKRGTARVSRLPFSIKILLEAALRQLDGFQVREEDVLRLARWSAAHPGAEEVPFKPARVVMQDFTGVPAVVDLAALRGATARLGGEPKRINPVIPVDLVIDHSVQVDAFGSAGALRVNAQLEFERNRERYEFLRWGAGAFRDFQVVPPATGIVHQVNLEYLAKVVQVREESGERRAFPDSLVGTDSHTTMINGLGVLGWGVGGIEAEAAMLGQPLYMLPPAVVGFKLNGELPEGATATDLVLTVTEILRKHGVVEKFVEFYGSGLSRLSLADRATIANMAPEYGATVGFFPVDAETLRYLAGTGRPRDLVDLVERYMKEQGLFRTDSSPEPEFSERLELDLSRVEPCLAGPKRPQDRIALRRSKEAFHEALEKAYGMPKPANGLSPRVEVEVGGRKGALTHGAVVIAAITSCTNTSNPSVMVGAGILARKAVECGLRVPAYVKTSLAPGSRVVTKYLEGSGLAPYLDQLGFHTVGYGCTTCIGNSGPLPAPVLDAVQKNNLVVAAVLSGNRNFEGRINPSTRANYLASPPLVVAYALAGTMDIDFAAEPLGQGKRGEEVFLRDIWPTPREVQEAVAKSLKPDLFSREYRDVFAGSEEWNRIPTGGGELYAWDPDSTYIREPSFFSDLTLDVPPLRPLRGARVLAMLGDSITTDHISPAGSIPADSPAARYLIEHGVSKEDFNSYGARRGNHEVMVRGTFGNIRLRNALAGGVEGGWTTHQPSGDRMTIYDAAMRYQKEGVPLVVLAGKEYGAGSSRDWAAKGVFLLGVKAAIAESYERIHRSNLVGMGVLPLEFKPGEGVKSLGLSGKETYEVEGLGEGLKPRQEVVVSVRETGRERTFRAVVRIDSLVEVEYYRNGGILHTVLRQMLRGESTVDSRQSTDSDREAT